MSDNFNDRLEAFIKAKGVQPHITDLRDDWLATLSDVAPAIALLTYLHAKTFLTSIGAPHSPIRIKFMAYVAALDEFDRTTRAEFTAAERARDIMLADD